MTPEVERAQRAHLQAHSTLLYEFEELSDKQVRRLERTAPDLLRALDSLKEHWRAFADTIVGEEISRSDDPDEDCVPCVRVLGELEWEWWALPEADTIQVVDGFTNFVRILSKDRFLLIRSWQSTRVREVRNVPPGHPFLESCITFTLDNQGIAEPVEELFGDPEYQALHE